MKKLSFLKCFVETLPVASESLVKTLRATSLLGMMVLAPMGASAQVTIGSGDLPAATLDVVATKTDGSTAEGVIAPRLTLAQLKAADARYLAAQTGAIVYVTDATGGTTAKTANVTAAGYYYFDGTVWQKMGGVVAADMPDVITADNGLTENPNNNIQLGGTLTKNTTIDQGSFSLTHSGTGKTVISTPLQYNNSGAAAGAGKVLTSDASGNATWQPAAINILQTTQFRPTTPKRILIRDYPTQSTVFIDTDGYVDLTPGKYMVVTDMPVYFNFEIQAFESIGYRVHLIKDGTTTATAGPVIYVSGPQRAGIMQRHISMFTLNTSSDAGTTRYYVGYSNFLYRDATGTDVTVTHPNAASNGASFIYGNVGGYVYVIPMN